MEQVDRDDIVVTERSSVVASKESNKTSTRTDVEEQLQLADGDAVLKCFTPLLNSMKLFGLYFTPAAASRHRIHDTSTGTTHSHVAPSNWNAGRVYATVILVVVWLNAARMLTVFDKNLKFGAVLLTKLAAVSHALFCALQQAG